MKSELLNIICCPDCLGRFELMDAETRDSEIISGSLACRKCKMKYPIYQGLPIILKQIGDMDKTKEAFGRQWSWQSADYFEENTIYGKNENEELEDFSNIFGIEDFREFAGKIILDCGCGSGRLTKNIAQAAEDAVVIGIDISDAARVAHYTYGAQMNAHFIQCDLLHPPFRLK